MNQPETQNNSLEKQPIDRIVSELKALFGVAPIVGPIISEIIGNTIPNQRIDRIARFVKELESRIAHVEEELLKSKMQDENFIDLIEECLLKASRAVSNDRLKYIAALLVNGIKSEHISFIESKHLLGIIGELNDIEIIWLQYYAKHSQEESNDFYEKHKEVLSPACTIIGIEQVRHDKNALRKSYQEHLAQLGLLNRIYRNFKESEPQFDFSSAGLEVWSYKITPLGYLILRQIDLQEISQNINKWKF